MYLCEKNQNSFLKYQISIFSSKYQVLYKLEVLFFTKYSICLTIYDVINQYLR
jgi:hypothetical protein